jgi:hypothetical protein
MKTQFKISMLMPLLLLALTTSAQVQRYIETTVSDTVTLKALQFKYQVTAGYQPNQYDDSYGLSQLGSDTVSASLKEVEKTLKKEKFTCAFEAEKNYTIEKSGKKDIPLVVTLKSKAELDRLIKVLQGMEGISGKILSTDYESPSLYYDAMFKRLYDKALTEVTSLAKISGSTIGSLLSASEITDASNSYFDWIMELSKSSPYSLLGLPASLDKVYTRKFSFRFELK